MKLSNKTIVSLLIVGAIGVLLGSIWFRPNVSFSSVSVASEYTATTTDATSAGTHSLIKVGSSCVLGSVVIASSSATTLTLWNASSLTDASSSTLVTFKADITEGTYTFDVVCLRGLVIETPAGFDGEYIVIWR